MKRIYSIVTFFIIFHFSVLSQTAKINWIIKPEPEKVFIENKGQFPVTNHGIIKSSDILYAYDGGPTMIYFTKTGMTYTFNKKLLKNRNEEHKKGKSDKDFYENEKKEKEIKTLTDIVHISWINSDADVQVVPEELVTEYFSYGIRDGKQLKNLNYLRAYKKLIYKNLYKGIDVEFVFHPDEGIKYSVVIHPGADIRLFSMKISNSKGIILNNTGDLHIPTKFGDIVDYAPMTYYQDDKSSTLSSKFLRKDKSVSFVIGEYDHNKTVIIDPWTVSPPFPATNRVWAIDKDGQGNAYLYGGDMPMTLKKYSSAGNPQWSYATPWDSSGYWVGTMCTDRAGNAYVTSGSNGEISKINTSGGLVWYNNPNGALGPLFEYWDISFNCDETQMIVGGMRTASAMGIGQYRGAMMNIDQSSGAVNGFRVVGYIAGMNIKEARTISGATNRNFYFLTLDSLGCIDPSLNILWKVSHTYNFSYGNPTYQANGNLGFRAIRANDSYLYTMSGATIHRRNISDGSIINGANIPGGIYNPVPILGGYTVGNSGLEVDSCGNVYVGSGDGVYKYDAALNILTSITTPGAVYDVAVSPTGDVFACGNGYALSANMSSCQPYRMFCCPTINIDFTNIVHMDCSGNLGSFTADPVGASAPFHYTLQSSGGITVASFTNVNGPQNFSNLAADTYTLLVTDRNNCSSSADITITQPSGMPTPSISGPTEICAGNTAVLDAGAGYDSYIWSTGSSNQSINVTASGNYTVTVSNSSGCSGSASLAVSVVQSITVTVSASPQTVCPGLPSLLTANGGGTYQWSTGGAGETITVNPINTSSYSVTVTNNGCTGTSSITVFVDSVLHVNATSHNASCGQSDGSATVDVPAGNNYTFIWSTTPVQTTQTATNLAVGSYQVTVTNNGCKGVTSVTIVYDAGPHASFYASPTEVTVGEGDVNFSDRSTGNIAQSIWYFGDDSYATGFNALHGYADTGRYLVTHIVIDSGGCVDTAYTYIHVVPYFSFFIPNAFTPNAIGDGINDYFMPKGNGLNLSTYKMAIYNRWGQRVFETTDMSEGWNGTYENKDRPEKAVEGVYVYIITFREINGREHKYVGSVTLIQ